jgi:hypothetical protein
MTDIADQHQAAARKRDLATAGRGIDTIRFQFPRQGAAGFLKGGLQLAPHQAQPIGIGSDLVRAIHRGDAVFQIGDSGDSRFHQDVGHTGFVAFADGMIVVDLNLDMQTVMGEQDRVGRLRAAAITGEG